MKTLPVMWIKNLENKHLGMRIELNAGGTGIVRRMSDGTIAPRASFRCNKNGCRRMKYFFLKDGAAGEGQFAYTKDGQFVGDLRDQYFVCKKHRK